MEAAGGKALRLADPFNFLARAPTRPLHSTPVPMTRITDNRPGLWSRLKRLATSDVGALLRKFNAEDLERIEQLLLEADFGVQIGRASCRERV